MQKVQSVVDSLIVWGSIIILFLAGILVGSSLINNVQFLYVLTDIVTIIYIVGKGIKKEKIINDKIDIYICVLLFSSIVPILFGTYTSLNDSIGFVLKYSTIVFMYFIVKDSIRNNKKILNCYINTILSIGVVLVFLGMDRLTYHYFKPIVEYLNITNLYQGEIRLTSLFSYANSFAAVVGSCVFLSLGQSLNSDKIVVKSINNCIIFNLLCGLILSLSRMMYIVMIIIMIIYIYLNKNNKKRIEILENLISIGILSVIYSAIFMKVLPTGEYNIVWINLIIFNIFSFIITNILRYINNSILKISKTKLIIIIISVVCIISIIGIILIKTPENLTLFFTSTSEKKVERHLSKIEGETKYVLKFDINAITQLNQESFCIEVLERNEYWENLNRTNICFGNYSGTKEIEINTNKETTDIYIIFSAIEVNENTKLEIKKFELNGKEKILNYKFLPYDFVSKIENINFTTQSVIDRITYIKDAWKIIKDNWIFGIGGDGWQYRYMDVQEQTYVAREVHSYPIQILLEFGIIRIYIIYYSNYNNYSSIL